MNRVTVRSVDDNSTTTATEIEPGRSFQIILGVLAAALMLIAMGIGQLVRIAQQILEALQ